MPSMDVGVEIAFGDEASGEIVLSVDFKYRGGEMASFYPPDPGSPAEVEIETIFWPVQRWDAEKREHVADHIEMPYFGLPQSVAEAIEAYIVERYEPEES